MTPSLWILRIPQQATWLDYHLTKETLVREIGTMQDKKSLGIDGLPVEFYKSFKDVLVGPLLELWNEALTFEALPYTMNEGIIKLIHKKDDKESLSNKRPITMLKYAYKNLC